MSDFYYRHSIAGGGGGGGGYQHQRMAEARVYVPTAGGSHRTETQTLPLPDRFVRSAFWANNQQQPFGARYGGASRPSSVIRGVADRLFEEPIPPKPPAYREKITDKLADVFNVLTTLSELKCDVHLVSAIATTTPLQACRYRFDAADQPPPPSSLLPHWIRLHDALLLEYRPVCDVLQLLADWCGTDRTQLASRTCRDNLTCALAEFQRSHRLGILRVSGAIGSEAEHEVQTLVQTLDNLFYSVRRASTDIWLMRTLLLCRRQGA